VTQIEEFQPAHRSDVLSLYRDVFGTWSAERFAARWDWQFAANPFVAERKPLIQVALENGRLIGHLASFPIPLRLQGRRKIALCASDFVVDGRHPMAAAAMFRSLLRQSPILATGFGTPAESMLRLSGATLLPASSVSCSFRIRSIGALRRALKRRLPSRLSFLAAPLFARPLAQWWKKQDPPPRREPRLSPQGGPVRTFLRFTAEHEEFWTEVSAGRGGGVDKDARYMNWRYAEGPARSLIFLELRGEDDRLRGITIGGVRADLHEHVPCGTTGVVCEFWVRPGDDDAARRLAFGILERLDLSEVDGVHIPGVPGPIQGVLVGSGFVRSESKEYQVAIKADPGDLAPAAATDPENCWASAGDGDMLLTTML
jgi:hypothetical protein